MHEARPSTLGLVAPASPSTIPPASTTPALGHARWLQREITSPRSYTLLPFPRKVFSVSALAVFHICVKAESLSLALRRM